MVQWTSPLCRQCSLCGSRLGASAFARRPKIRVIDDYSVFGHNDATSIPEKITLGSVDVVAVLLKLLFPTLSNNSFSVTLSDGSVLQGDVHLDWRREGLQLVGKCYDLKSAYKQWALAPFTEPFAVTSVWNPLSHVQNYFNNAPFLLVARSSVHHFNWVARMILHVMVSGLHMMSTSLFDDFPTMALNSEATSLAQCVDFFFALMGWSLKDTPAFQQEFPALGVLIDLGGVRAGNVQIRNTEARLDELNNTIREIGERRTIEPQEARVLPGSCSPGQIRSLR